MIQNLFIIYKQTLDNKNKVSNVEMVECEADETNTIKFTKLYNLQIPHDLRKKVSYHYALARIN